MDMCDPFQREVDPMQAIYWDVLLILGLILASGLLAMSEFAIGSARKSRLRDLVEPGIPRRGGRAAPERGPQGLALDGPGGDDAPGHLGRRVRRGEPGAQTDAARRASRPAGAVSPRDRRSG